MAQAYVNYFKHLEKQINASVQTGSENVNIVYHLPNNKMIRLYYSNIYKEKVVSFNISTSKSFIINKEIWSHMRKLLPIIDNHLK
jgi:3-hydroxy-3-methylglutaryl CoA synthase